MTTSLTPIEHSEKSMYKLDKTDGETGIVNGGKYVQTDEHKTAYPLVEKDAMATKKDEKSSLSGDSEGKDEKAAPPPMVGFGEVFRFADQKDRFLMVFGTIMACLHGAAMPCMIIVFGQMTDLFINDALIQGWLDLLLPNITAIYPNVTREYLEENPNLIIDYLRSVNMTDTADRVEDQLSDSLFNQMRQYSVYYAILGAVVLVIGYAQVACWQTASFNQCQRIRQSLFRSILKQEIGWFDTHESGELNTRLSDDVDKIEGGIGDKLSMFFQYFCGFLAGFIIGFVYGWKLTLVILSVSPLLAASGAVMARLGARLTSQELQSYAKAGAVAEEVLGAMRTVVAFGGQERESERYAVHLVDARKFGIKKGLINGIAMGVVFFVMFGSYGLAFWYGAKLVREDEYTAGSVLTVFFAVLIGAFSLGNAGPNIQEFSNSRGAAYAIYAIIDLVPSIDSSSSKGKKLDVVKGNVEFRGVVFRYPSRPDVPVLSGINLRVDVGQTVALVGPSGCGKSTTVSLLQRFYDPLEGQVLLDGVDLRELNLTWLRQQIGVVSQEPVLFATTIRENLIYGRDGVTQEEIEKATKQSNAHDFISKLPKGYDTLVGERGAQLSGGQKQRIAIARALVRDPKVLLLDEATSALDTESEASVQAALDKARQGRTTLIVAHRLSTVQNADLIAGFSNGAVTELGSHEQLMQEGGIYYTLCTNQSMLGDEYIDLADVKPKRDRALSDSSDRFTLQRLTSTRSLTKGEVTLTSVASVTEEDEKLPDPELKRIMRLNAPEAGYIVAGCIGAVIMGGIQPAFAIIFSEILGVFSELDPVEMESRANLYSGLFAVIGVVAFLAMFTMSYAFSRSGEFLTMRLRGLTFKAYLRQDVSYFDDSRNSTGALCTRLATDASAVKGATGSRLATVCQSTASMGAGLGIGFAYSWQLTLLILGFAPFILVAGFVQMKMYTGSKDGVRQGTEEAGKIATEAIENIRTVAQLTKEEKFHSDYSKALSFPYDANRKKAHVQGFAYASSQAVLFFAYAGCFTLGAFLVQRGDITYDNMFKVFSAIVFSAMSVGQATSFAPDYGKAKTSAAKIFQLFDREPLIDSFSEEGRKMDDVTGSVKLRDVKFSYPTRATVPVLKGVDLDVNPGEVVALVGSSGCGKSTIIQLLERFYDPSGGSVLLDDHVVTDLNVQWYRSQVGIVSQEPILFDCSIRDNISYGDNSRRVAMDEIIAAAKQANIHNFIESLPLGYDTNVGDKGAQLSGGQKQRVAIARALVRNPKVLLLDEATSALDTESEKIVQEALERAQKGRTSIVIAHRLSTIQNANKIHVIQNGQVVETGTHSELFAMKGAYYRLNLAQLRQM